MPADETQLVEDILKTQFVKEWLRTNDPFKAAHAVFPADPGRAMRASWEWTKDAEVIEYRDRLITQAETEDRVAGVPTKEEFAREIYLEFQTTRDSEYKIASARLFTEVMGWTGKGSQVNVDNRKVITVNKVMVIRDHGDNGAWERSLGDQQKRLQAG